MNALDAHHLIDSTHPSLAMHANVEEAGGSKTPQKHEQSQNLRYGREETRVTHSRAFRTQGQVLRAMSKPWAFAHAIVDIFWHFSSAFGTDNSMKPHH